MQPPLVDQSLINQYKRALDDYIDWGEATQIPIRTQIPVECPRYDRDQSGDVKYLRIPRQRYASGLFIASIVLCEPRVTPGHAVFAAGFAARDKCVNHYHLNVSLIHVQVFNGTRGFADIFRPQNNVTMKYSPERGTAKMLEKQKQYFRIVITQRILFLSKFANICALNLILIVKCTNSIRFYSANIYIYI